VDSEWKWKRTSVQLSVNRLEVEELLSGTPALKQNEQMKVLKSRKRIRMLRLAIENIPTAMRFLNIYLQKLSNDIL
jgi:catechol-2,3-dioxygenase